MSVNFLLKTEVVAYCPLRLLANIELALYLNPRTGPV